MSGFVERKDIRFPKNYYVGILGRQEDVLPLGFMTEDGTDKAAEKRKQTVNSWAGSKGSARTYENKPLIGFRLGRSVRRDSGWGSGNVKWRIEDPRGFELEITSPNMAQIVDSCVIQNGEILNECIWARLRGDNVLVPVESQLYTTVKENSERREKSVKPSSVQIGNEIVLQNGLRGVYYGKYYEIGGYYYNVPVSSKPKHVMLNDSIIDFATFKPAEIVGFDVFDPKEAEAKLFEMCASKLRGSYYFACSKPDLKTVHYLPTDFDSAVKQPRGRFIAQISSGELVYMNMKTNYHNSDIDCTVIDEKVFNETGEIRPVVDQTATRAINTRNIFFSSHHRNPIYVVHTINKNLLKGMLSDIRGTYRKVETDLGNTFYIPC